MKPYIILFSGDIRDLMDRVKDAILNGYKCQGGIAASGGMLYQAMIQIQA
jgi:hypothetical protein